MPRKRSEQRFLCSDLVSLEVQNADGNKELLNSAVLEGISASGACVQLEAGIQAGASVQIVCGPCTLRGKVKYCRFAGIGYDVGIRFDKPGSWSREQFEPAHLLALPIAKKQVPKVRAAGSPLGF